jgi:hypothetical protein
MSDEERPPFWRRWFSRGPTASGDSTPGNAPPAAPPASEPPEPPAPLARPAAPAMGTPEPPPPGLAQRPSFGIRRVARAPAAQPPPAAFFAAPPEPPPPASVEPEVMGDDLDDLDDLELAAEESLASTDPVRPPGLSAIEASRTGVLFLRAADALSFLGAISGSGLASRASSLRGPEGRFWVEVPVSPRRTASMASLAAGRPFAGEGAHWVAVLSDGQPIAPEVAPPDAGRDVLLITGSRIQRLQPGEWRAADLRDLLSATSLRGAVLRARPEVAAAVPSAFTRWVLGRAIALGIEVSLVPAERRPLLGDEPVEGIVWMRMRAPGSGVSSAWIGALADLPGVLVTYPVGVEAARLFVDVRCETPLSGPLLESLLPGDEAWLLGAADVGHARIRPAGELVDGAALINPPAPAAAPLALPGAARMPEPIPVRLVRRHVARPTDAVLLDEQELGWLRSYLMTRPVSEEIFLVGGGDRFLVLAAGDIAAKAPFGIELSRVGPGGLYVEQGLDFFPPLPEAARLSAFRAGEYEVVVLTEGGCHRFQAGDMVPAWSLWAGAAPEMKTQVPGETMRRLQEITKALQWKPSEPALARARPTGGPPVAADAGDRAQIRAEAAQAALRGDLAGAARQLERAGDFRAAGRLYERAARGAR